MKSDLPPFELVGSNRITLSRPSSMAVNESRDHTIIIGDRYTLTALDKCFKVNDYLLDPYYSILLKFFFIYLFAFYVSVFCPQK